MSDDFKDMHIPLRKHHRGKVSLVDFPNDKLTELLVNLAALYELNVLVPEEIEDLRVSVKLHHVHWSDVFDWVLPKFGYDWYVENEVVHLVLQDDEVDPIYTDIDLQFFHVKTKQAEPIARLFVNQDDKESAVVKDDRMLRFHIRKSRLSSLKIFIENLDEAFNSEGPEREA